jgi:hypothetical protein
MASKLAAVLTEATEMMIKIHAHGSKEYFHCEEDAALIEDDALITPKKTVIICNSVWDSLGIAWTALPFLSLSPEQQEICTRAVLHAHRHVDRFNCKAAMKALTAVIDALETMAPLTLAWVELDMSEEQATQTTPPRPTHKKLKTQSKPDSTISPADMDKIGPAVFVSSSDQAASPTGRAKDGAKKRVRFRAPPNGLSGVADLDVELPV